MESVKNLPVGIITSTAAIIAISCAGVSYFVWKRMVRFRDAGEALHYLSINVVTTESSCHELVHLLRRSSLNHKSIGFDCEWVCENGTRRPVALLQLSTYDGLCGLFRLNRMKNIPHSLKELLEDETIYKVGVAPNDDAKYLYQDYGVMMKSTLDVRHIVKICGYTPGGLAALAKSHLGLILDKSWRIRCSDWEAESFTQRQIKYAAADAHVAIKIFIKLVKSYNKKGLTSWFRKENSFLEILTNLHCTIEKFVDLGFKSKPYDAQKQNVNKPVKRKENRYPHCTRTKPLYHNCFLAAPDGEILCTCDNKKAQWYLDKGLADMVSETPFTVKLRFEPSSRMVGDAGRYYQLTKENKCVVCGNANTYIRKNVVPREYRKYFPDVMKEHSSHDVVLLCVQCHRRSNLEDQALRLRLAERCQAPLSAAAINGRYIQNADLKKVKSAARALSQQAKRHVLPEARRQQLERLLLDHYPHCSQVTQQLLDHAANLQVLSENPQYESHGLKVVEYYLELGGGLLQLEHLWREHFLNSMKPRHLPALWSIKHNEERLRIRWNEGRLSEEEMKLIGSRWQ